MLCGRIETVEPPRSLQIHSQTPCGLSRGGRSLRNIDRVDMRPLEVAAADQPAVPGPGPASGILTLPRPRWPTLGRAWPAGPAATSRWRISIFLLWNVRKKSGNGFWRSRRASTVSIPSLVDFYLKLVSTSDPETIVVIFILGFVQAESRRAVQSS